MANNSKQSDRDRLHQSRRGLHTGHRPDATPEEIEPDSVGVRHAVAGVIPPLASVFRPATAESTMASPLVDFGLALLCCGGVIAALELARHDGGATLFLCLLGVVLVARYCGLGARLLAGTILACFAAYQLPPMKSMQVAAAYQLMFAAYLAISSLICLDGRDRLLQKRFSRHIPTLPQPQGSPEQILDTEIKPLAAATGKVPIPRERVYAWARECAHLRDLIWNIDDCWRRRDWTMLAHAIKIAYRQVARVETALLECGALALKDPADAVPDADATPRIQDVETPIHSVV